ncbi:MAG: transposase [Oscillospiraceae bacterium]|nr:transposase [Oscillospiraceae bacterium]
MEQIAIFCDTDDFCKAYEEYCRNKLLMDKEAVVPRTRISLSEIMTILILSFCLTSGNIDDRNEAVMDSLTKEIFGKLFADRGYISQKLFEKLLKKDIILVTRAKKNRKNKLMDFYDRLVLRKRTVIESVNDFLKNICDIEHFRHRSVTNFLVNLVSALAAYSFLPKKPSVCSASNIPKGFLCILD